MIKIRQGIILGFSALIITACGDRANSITNLNTNPSPTKVFVPTINKNAQTSKSVNNVNTIALANLKNGYEIKGYNYNNTPIVLSFCKNTMTYSSLVEKFIIINDTMKTPSVVIQTAKGVLNINSNYELGIYNDITITSISAIGC